MITRARFPLFALLTAAFLITGCASASRQDMLRETEDFELPGLETRESGKAQVYVVRPTSVGALIRFNVFVWDSSVDSLEAGFTRGNQHIFFNVGPGNQRIISVAENDAVLPLRLEPNGTYFIRQDATMGFIMARNKLVQIDSVEGKYWVKKTDPGSLKRVSFP